MAHSSLVIGQLRSAPNARTFSYRTDFRDLWGFVTSIRAGAPWPEALKAATVVIWDDIGDVESPSDFPYRNYLTAFDWTVALAVATAERLKAEPSLVPPTFRLHIYDDTERGWSESFSAGMGPGLPALLPWLRLYRGTSETQELQNSLFQGRATGTGQDPEGWLSSAERVRRLWISELAKPGDRHAVSNAIGPRALGRALGDAGFTVLRTPTDTEALLDAADYLELLANVLGQWSIHATTLHKEPQPRLGGLGMEPQIAADLFGRFREIRFALVDDQARAGFHEALAAFLLGKKRGAARNCDGALAALSSTSGDGLSLTSFTSPDVLLAWLRSALQCQPAGSPHPRIFGKAMRPNSSPPLPNFDVLFLDLRLHGISRRKEVLDQERRFLEDLVKVADEFGPRLAENGLDLGQLRVFGTALEAARTRLKYLKTDEEAAEERGVVHLALLPILISACDPTTPIILFSSTGQRSIAQLLGLFPNIITSFSKPGVSGYADDDGDALGAVVPALQRALEDALRLHERRLVWEHAFDLDLSESPPPAILRTWSEPVTNPAGKTVYIEKFQYENLAETTLPFAVHPNFEYKLFGLILSFVIRGADDSFLFRPHEFLESSLLFDRRCSGGSDDRLSFSKPDFGKVFGDERAKSASLTSLLNKARNNFAHGLLVTKNIPPGSLQAIAQFNVLIFLYVLSLPDGRERILNEVVRVSGLGGFVFQALGEAMVPLDGVAAAIARDARQIWPSLRLPPAPGNAPGHPAATRPKPSPSRKASPPRRPPRARVKPDPSALDQFKVGEAVHGRVQNVTEFGVFVAVDGFTGLLHKSQLPKGYANPGDFLRSGDRTDLWVLDVDYERGRLSFTARPPSVERAEMPAAVI